MHRLTVLFLILIAFSCNSNNVRNSEYLDHAKKVDLWLKQQKLTKEQGVIWRSSDEQQRNPISNANLYNGSSGVILFYLELYHQTGEDAYLEEAKAGADYLLWALEQQTNHFATGLFTGASGLAFTLAEVHKATGEAKYKDAVMTTIASLENYTNTDVFDNPAESVSDIVSGHAGMGLFLLYAHDEFDDPKALTLAEKVGQNLIRSARDTVGGLKWMMYEGFPRYMPNFSHGTAGNAFFLARLSEATNNTSFLEIALKGASHLTSITNENGLVYHHDPDTTNLIYYGWCHGPAGTGQLYNLLAKLDDREKWNTQLASMNNGLANAKIPHQHPAGFWQNVGQCCGSAGVAEYFLALNQINPSDTYDEIVNAMTMDILSNATEEGAGLKWIHAENRSQPENLQAQTGYMQGAAGMGLFFLHMHAIENGKSINIKIPGKDL